MKPAPRADTNIDPDSNDEITTSLYKRYLKLGKVSAYFVSVGSNSIVSNFDSKICSKVAVPQSQITMRAQRKNISMTHWNQLDTDRFTKLIMRLVVKFVV